MEKRANELNELNENEMSITNMPAIIVPMPPPLVRQVCYLPEHYPPFAPHSDEPNCPCSFCVQDRFAASAKELKEAIKEVQQIEVLEAEQNLRDSIKEKIRKDLVTMTDKLRSANAILEQEEVILLEPEEEILLEPVSRSLGGFAIPTLSRSTNDPSTWGPADDEEILLVGI
jgi:hypothetical protein